MRRNLPDLTDNARLDHLFWGEQSPDAWLATPFSVSRVQGPELLNSLQLHPLASGYPLKDILTRGLESKYAKTDTVCGMTGFVPGTDIAVAPATAVSFLGLVDQQPGVALRVGGVDAYAEEVLWLAMSFYRAFGIVGDFTVSYYLGAANSMFRTEGETYDRILFGLNGRFEVDVPEHRKTLRVEAGQALVLPSAADYAVRFAEQAEALVFEFKRTRKRDLLSLVFEIGADSRPKLWPHPPYFTQRNLSTDMPEIREMLDNVNKLHDECVDLLNDDWAWQATVEALRHVSKNHQIRFRPSYLTPFDEIDDDDTFLQDASRILTYVPAKNGGILNVQYQNSRREFRVLKDIDYEVFRHFYDVPRFRAGDILQTGVDRKALFNALRLCGRYGIIRKMESPNREHP